MPVLLSILFHAAALVLGVEGGDIVERRLALMGTLAELRVEAHDRPAALRASEAAVRALEATERRLSTWIDDSELARLNRAPVGVETPIGEELAADLRAAKSWWKRSGGAFDAGVGGLVEAWGLRSGGRRPADDEIRGCLDSGGLASLELHASSAVRTHAALVIEEGAFGKGVGLDAALRALHEAGASAAVIDLGGQVAVLGEDEDLTWAVADPRDRDRPVVEVALASGSLATSGNAERGIVVDGERLGHVLDPRSGRPVPDRGSATVWAPDATAADCASTAVYVLGPDDGLAWAAEQPEIEALWIEPVADGLRARATEGLAPRLRPIAEELRLETFRVTARGGPGELQRRERGSEPATRENRGPR